MLRLYQESIIISIYGFGILVFFFTVVFSLRTPFLFMTISYFWAKGYKKEVYPEPKRKSMNYKKGVIKRRKDY